MDLKLEDGMLKTNKLLKLSYISIKMREVNSLLNHRYWIQNPIN